MKTTIKTTKSKEPLVMLGSIGLPINKENTAYIPHSDDYVDTHGHLETIAYAINENLPVLLIGETGTGKTSAVRHLASVTNNSFRRINLNGSTTVDELVGKILINKDGTFWTDGVLIDAMRNGHWLLLDEINAALPEVLFVLHSLLDDDGYVVLSEKEDHEIVRPHKNFRIFATCNPFERYSGTKELNKAFLSRFPVVIDIPYPTENQEMEILNIKTKGLNVSKDVLEGMIKTANSVRDAVEKEEMDFVFSTRDLVYWARMYAYMRNPMKSAMATFMAKANKEDRAGLVGIIGSYVPDETLVLLNENEIKEHTLIKAVKPIKLIGTKKEIPAGTELRVSQIVPKDISPIPGEQMFVLETMESSSDLYNVSGVEINKRVCLM